MLSPVVRRTYAPRGQTPVQYSWDRRDRISAISAVTFSPKRRLPGLIFRLLPDNENVHATDTVSYLGQVRRHRPGPLLIVWDRGNVHDRSLVVRKYLAKHPEIVTAKLPAYAPDLNPDEQVWSYAKYSRLCNFAAKSTLDLRQTLMWELQDMQERPELLRSFIDHSGLTL